MKAPFELGIAIQNWRESLAQSPAVTGECLAEMESHLHDAIATLQTRGLTEEESFLIATRRLGRTETLAQEFGKVNVAAVWRDRALWMLAGMLFLMIGADLGSTISSLLAVLGSLVSANGFALGWLSVAGVCVTFGAAAITLSFLWSGRLQALQAYSASLRNRPGLVLAGALTCLIALNLAPRFLTLLLIRNVPMQTVGQTFLVMQYFEWVGPILLGCLLLVVFSRVWRRKHGLRTQTGAYAIALPFTLALTLSAAQAETSTSDQQSAATMDQVMSLWRAGKKDEAVTKFLVVDFSRRPLFSTGSVLNLTEAQFVALPEAARTKLATQMNDDLKTIKELAAQTRNTAKAALASGDKTKSEKCVAQLKACGQAFDQPDSLVLLKLVGKALEKMSAAPLK